MYVHSMESQFISMILVMSHRINLQNLIVIKKDLYFE